MQAIGEDWSLDLAQQRRISEMDSGYSYFEDGDIAVAKVTPCFENGKAVIMHGLTEGSGFGTTEVTVIRPKPISTPSICFMCWSKMDSSNWERRK